MSRMVEVRPGAYHDSVSLMQVSQGLQQREDVTAALVAMATELNLDLLAGLGFEPPPAASPNDLVVAIEATSTAGLDSALAALESALAPSKPGSSGPGGAPEVRPRTVTAAIRRAEPGLVLVSTPGRVAAIDAADALGAGVDVMIFSDNVSVEHEVALKELAAVRGNLVMGPDCGTAVVDGVGLGFANVVRPGPVGIVAASGTGAQHLLCLLDGADIGVSQCLGVGGRDLSAEVAGRSTGVALERLAGDDSVEVIVLISKPPAPEVAADITALAQSLGKPVVLGFLEGEDIRSGAMDLTATARAVAQALDVAWVEPRRWGEPAIRVRTGDLRGLFVGGTLCDEAMQISAPVLGRIASNISLAGQPALDDQLTSSGHTFIDFGDDRLTVGRPHPMIDPSWRLARLRRELADDDCAVVLLDVVLGHGAHSDPATDLAAALGGADKPVVVSLIGTRGDPQHTAATAKTLAEAGAVVHASNSAATREALSLLGAAT